MLVLYLLLETGLGLVNNGGLTTAANQVVITTSAGQATSNQEGLSASDSQEELTIEDSLEELTAADSQKEIFIDISLEELTVEDSIKSLDESLVDDPTDMLASSSNVALSVIQVNQSINQSDNLSIIQINQSTNSLTKFFFSEHLCGKPPGGECRVGG